MMRKRIFFMMLLCAFSVIFAVCKEKKDLEKLMDYWVIDEIEDNKVRIVFYEPHEEGYVRDTSFAMDASLSVMEQNYGVFKSSAEGNACGDVSFTIWNKYKREDDSIALDNERTIYGVYEQDSTNKTVILNILTDEEQVIVETRKYKYEFEDSFHLTLTNLEDSSERIELHKET